jgi:hypothetical protein
MGEELGGAVLGLAVSEGRRRHVVGGCVRHSLVVSAVDYSCCSCGCFVLVIIGSSKVADGQVSRHSIPLARAMSSMCAFRDLHSLGGSCLVRKQGNGEKSQGKFCCQEKKC